MSRAAQIAAAATGPSTRMAAALASRWMTDFGAGVAGPRAPGFCPLGTSVAGSAAVGTGERGEGGGRVEPVPHRRYRLRAARRVRGWGRGAVSPHGRSTRRRHAPSRSEISSSSIDSGPGSLRMALTRVPSTT